MTTRTILHNLVRPASRAALTVAAIIAVNACDRLLTEAPSDADLFDAPLGELNEAELALFLRGDEEFGRRFAPASGLGPIFNNVSCASCHSGDGRGHLDNSLFRIGSEVDDYMRAYGGPQIQT